MRPEIKPEWRETSQDSEGPRRWGPTMGQWKWDLNLPNLDQIHKSEDGFISRGDLARVIWRNLSFVALSASDVLLPANFPEGYFLWTLNYFPQELKQSGWIGLVECIYFWPQKATAGWDVKYHRMEIWDSGLSATGSRKPRRHGAPNYGAEPGTAGMRFGADADAGPLPKADTD